MPTAATLTWTNTGLKPVYDGPSAHSFNVKLPASQSYLKGTVLGEKSGNNEIQSLIIDATGGTFTVTHGGQTSAATAYNASAATMKTNLEAMSTIGTGNVLVTKIRNRWSLALAAGTDGGSFGLAITIGGVRQIVPNQAWNVSAANLDTAIEALSIVGTAGVAVALGSEIYTLVFAAALGDVQVEVVNDTTNDGGVWEQGIVVTETALGSAFTVEFRNALGNANTAAMTTTATSLTGGAGTATVATITAGSAGTVGEFAKVVASATDGSQVAKAILMFDSYTDASQNVTFGQVSSGGEFGQLEKVAPAYYCGTFKTTELVGFTAAMLSDLNGRLISGTIADGIIQF